jgi:tetratricopeptide (TPR) repeat protein
MNPARVGVRDLAEIRRLIAVARAAGRVGNYDTAAAVAAEAGRHSRAGGHFVEEAACLNVLGSVAFERGRFDEAEDHYGLALAAASSGASEEVAARACNNLASLKHLRGDSAGARSLYLTALLAYEKLGDPRGQAESYHNVAITFREEGELAAAKRADQTALEHAAAAGDAGTLALVHSSLAETALLAGDPAVALAQLEEAEFQAWIVHDPLASAEVHRVRAIYLGSVGEAIPALESVHHAARCAERHGSRLMQAECAELAARLLRQLGRETEAASQAESARQLFLALGAVGPLSRLR